MSKVRNTDPTGDIGRGKRSVVLGTAGHIDHGKTALVRALTGTDTDRLPEEKARGITIDLGFASMEIVSPDGQRFDVSLIDVPGHHAFVRNMLAGAGGIDAVMLVVAADEGVKAQTVEHLAICRMLGIERGLVVLTKRDAVSPDRLNSATLEVAQLVSGTFLEHAPVLAVSALRQEGLSELKEAIARLAATVPARSADRVARMPVDRVFSVRGFGTVVTGTLQDGTVRTGETLALQPGSRPVRVRGLQVHNRTVAQADAPNRVALNLAGVEVAQVRRGYTVVRPETLRSTTLLDAQLDMLPDAPRLRHRQRVRVHAFASESLAMVLLYSGSEMQSQGAASVRLVRLRLLEPILVAPGDRFVLRQPSPAATVGGGKVLDAAPLAHLRKAETERWLRELQQSDASGMIRMRVGRRGWSGLQLSELVAETGWTRDALRRTLAPMLADGTLVEIAGTDTLFTGVVIAELQESVVREITRAKDGAIGRAELRSRLHLTDAALSFAVDRIVSAKRAAARGEVLVLPDSAQKGAQGNQLSGRALDVERVYREAGLASPTVSEAAERLRVPAAEMRGLVTLLLRAGKLVRMGSDTLLVHTAALERLIGELRKHRGESFDVGRFKAFTGLSRKHAIPILEYLDGARVTRNAGGVRVVL